MLWRKIKEMQSKQFRTCERQGREGAALAEHTVDMTSPSGQVYTLECEGAGDNCTPLPCSKFDFHTVSYDVSKRLDTCAEGMETNGKCNWLAY